MTKKPFFLFLSFLFFLFSVSFAYSTGQGLSNIQEVNSAAVQPKSLVFTPSSGTASIGNEFFVEVIAYPFYENVHPALQKVNNIEFSVYYDANFIDYSFTENLLNGFDLEASPATGLVKIKLEGFNPFQNFFGFQPTKLVRIKFRPNKETASASITANSAVIINSYGSNGQMAVLIQNYQPANIAVKAGSACVPNCEEKTCGSNGCGGFCGTIDGQCGNPLQACTNGQCVCTPDCMGRSCGDDGCGGSCGVCSAGKICSSGVCSDAGVSAESVSDLPVVDSGRRSSGGGGRRLHPTTEPTGVQVPAQPVVEQPAVQPEQVLTAPVQEQALPQVREPATLPASEQPAQIQIPPLAIEQPKPKLSDYWWMLLIALIICFIIIVAVWYKHKKEKEFEQYNQPYGQQQNQQRYNQQYQQYQNQQRPPLQ